jgi:hypothetical protein
MKSLTERFGSSEISTLRREDVLPPFQSHPSLYGTANSLRSGADRLPQHRDFAHRMIVLFRLASKTPNPNRFAERC